MNVCRASSPQKSRISKISSTNDCPENVYSLVALKYNQASNVNDNQMLFCENMVN
jgi:hypothetical protein